MMDTNLDYYDGTVFQIYIEQVLAYMTLNKELDNMILRNNLLIVM